jgi:hypothetical protein
MVSAEAALRIMPALPSQPCKLPQESGGGSIVSQAVAAAAVGGGAAAMQLAMQRYLEGSEAALRALLFTSPAVVMSHFLPGVACSLCQIGHQVQSLLNQGDLSAPGEGGRRDSVAAASFAALSAACRYAAAHQADCERAHAGSQGSDASAMPIMGAGAPPSNRPAELLFQATRCCIEAFAYNELAEGSIEADADKGATRMPSLRQSMCGMSCSPQPPPPVDGLAKLLEFFSIVPYLPVPHVAPQLPSLAGVSTAWDCCACRQLRSCCPRARPLRNSCAAQKCEPVLSAQPWRAS